MASRHQPAAVYRSAVASAAGHRSTCPISHSRSSCAVAGPSSARQWSPAGSHSSTTASSSRTFATSTTSRSSLSAPPPPPNLPPPPPRPSSSQTSGPRPPGPPPPLSGRPAVFAHSRETPDYPVYYSSHPHISRSPTAPPPIRQRPPALVKRADLPPPPKPKSAFEDDTEDYLEAEQSLPSIQDETGLAQQGGEGDGSEPWRDPRLLPCATLARAVRGRQWSEARRQLSLLHESDAGALESHIYVGAAVDSLTTDELETDEERLEWFLHWYSLVPTFTGPEGTYETPAFVQQNRQLVDLLLQLPTQLSYLSRILVLFGEKRYAGFFGPLLMPSIAVFGPPEQAMDVWASVSDASGWSASDRNRHALANVTIHHLVNAGHFHDAAEAIVRVRASCTPRQVLDRRGSPTIRPLIPRSTLRYFEKTIRAHWGTDHPYVVAASYWHAAQRDKLSDVDSNAWLELGAFNGVKTFVTDRQVEWVPNRAELPWAIRRLLAPGQPPSMHSIMRVLSGVYALESPRMNLLGLLHRRISGITQVGRGSDDPSSDEHAWIGAEMLRLRNLGEYNEALRLFASRYLWIGLPTGPRWEEYRRLRTSTQEDVGLSEELVGHVLAGIKRRYIPPPHLVAMANECLVRFTSSSEEYDDQAALIEEDYASLVANTQPRDPARSSPQGIDSTPRIPLARLFDGTDYIPPAISAPPSMDPDSEPSSTSTADLALLSPADEISLPTRPTAVRITPWSSPPAPFFLPPHLLPARNTFVHYVKGLSRHEPTKGMAILRAMVDRKIHADTLEWAMVLEGFVSHDMIEFAITGLQTMEREGGIDIHRRGTSRTHRTHLGPVQPLDDDQEVADLPTPAHGVTIPSPEKAVPPTNAELYIRLIRAAQTWSKIRQGSTDVSRLFEEMMHNSGVVLNEKEKLEMVLLYARRGEHESKLSHDEGKGSIPPTEWERSPWGHPVHPVLEWDQFGQETGERQSPERRADWAMTHVDDGTPIESRLRQMLDHSKKAAWRKQAYEARRKAKQSAEYSLDSRVIGSFGGGARTQEETLHVEW